MKAITVIVFLVGVTMVFYSFVLAERRTLSGQTPQYGGVYRIPSKHMVSVLNPRNVVWMQDKTILQLIYSTLLRSNSNAIPSPGVCARWEMNKKSSVFDCYLRKDVYFHNGDKMEVEDVIYSLNYLLQDGGLDIGDLHMIRGMEDYWNGKTESIAGVYALNEDVLRVELILPTPTFPMLMANPRFVVLPKNLLGKPEEEFFLHPIGTGPFMYKKKTEDAFLLEANQKYFNGRPYLDSIEILKVGNVADAMKMLQQGHVHDLRNYDNRMSAEYGDTVRIMPSNGIVNLYIYPNNSVEPFSDKKMRKLLFSLVDKYDVLGKCNAGDSYATSIVPYGVSGSLNEDYHGDYDITYAERLVGEFNQSGYIFKPLNIYYVDYSLRRCIAESLDENFKQFNIPWKTVAVSYDKLAELFFANKIKAYIGGITLKNADAHSILKYFISSSSENVAHIDDEYIDNLIEESMGVADPHKKNEIYRSVNRRIMLKDYAHPICEVKYMLVYHKGVRVDGGGLGDSMFIDHSKLWLQ